MTFASNRVISRLVHLIILLSSYTVSGQSTDSTRLPAQKGNLNFGTSPTTFLRGELSFFGEYFYKNDRSVLLELGAHPNVTNSYSLLPFMLYNGVAIRISKLRHRHRREVMSFYHGSKLVLRYRWNDSVYYDPARFGGSCEALAYKQSMQLFTAGYQYTIGFKFYYKFLTVDTYYGLGPSLNLQRSHVFEQGPACAGGWYETDKWRNFFYPFISFSLGARFGLRFKK